MPRHIWLESTAGDRMYVGAEKDKDTDGWIIRLFDRNGKQVSPIVFRVSYEAADSKSGSSMADQLPEDIVTDIMHEMRRQVMEREKTFRNPAAK